MPASSTSAPERADQAAFEDALHAFRSIQSEAPGPPPAIGQVRDGLGMAELDAVAEALRLNMSDLQGVLGTSARTLQRRRKRGDALTAAESDRLWRLIYIWQRSHTAFASEEAARTWLKTSHGLLHGETPLQRLDTEPGLREVEDLLTTIDETGAA